MAKGIFERVDGLTEAEAKRALLLSLSFVELIFRPAREQTTSFCPGMCPGRCKTNSREACMIRFLDKALGEGNNSVEAAVKSWSAWERGANDGE